MSPPSSTAGAQPLRVADRVLVSVASVLRGPVVALAPVLGMARADLELSNASVALLVTLPVMCFGACSIPASWLIARWGTRSALTLALGGIVTGLLIRIVPDYAAAVAGTLVLGASITVANVAIPVVAHSRGSIAGERLTTRYVMVMNLVSLLATVLTAPLAVVASWQVAVTVPYAAMAVVLLVLVTRRRTWTSLGAPATVVPVASRGPGRRRRTAVIVPTLLTLAFAGQTLSYYGITSWLPTQLGELLGIGMVVAGSSSALFQLTGVIGPFLLMLLRRVMSTGACFLVVGAAWAVFPVGMLVLPQAWWAWCLVAGLAQGATFALVLTSIAEVSATERQARRLSSLVQSGGYAAGAVGPVLLGQVRDLSGSWTLPMIVVLAAAAIIPVCGAAAMRAARGVTPAREPRDPVELRPDPSLPAGSARASGVRSR